MGLQLVVQADAGPEVAEALGQLALKSEVFQVSRELWGVSIPTEELDFVGEREVRKRLSRFNVYDLFAGEWTYVRGR